jgi:hypothetical protein
MNFVLKRAIFFLFFTLLLCGCQKNSISPELATVNEMQKRVEDISIDVAAIRGMNYVRPVHVGVTTKKQYAVLTSRSISSSISSIEEAALSKEYAQMGLLAETDTPLNTILTDFYASFPAAYYSLGTDSLTIITDNDYEDYQLNMIIAHELTHALQDQNLNTGFSIFPGYSYYNSDASLAQRSLMEGDAFFTELVYFFKKYYSPDAVLAIDSSSTEANDYKKELLDASYSAVSPLFLDVKSIVPYYLGVAYVAEIYHTTLNWKAVNNLYSISTAPRSSAEINRISSASIAYFDFHAIQELLLAQSGSIEFADDDNAGFALLLGLFYGDLDAERAGRSLDWRGDRYTYVKRQGSGYGTLVWTMAFANEDGARYMCGKLVKKIGSRKLAGKTAVADSMIDSSGAASLYTFTSESAITKLKRAGNQLWWMENVDTLSPSIIAILEAQRAAPSLAKTGRTSSFPTSLSSETKRRVVEGIINHAFQSKGR